MESTRITTLNAFPVLIFCMAVLTLSMPYATLAQQNAVRVAAETAAAQDANAMRFDAKAAAEQDANLDVNKLLWFAAGVGTCCIGGPIGGLAGALIGDFIAPRDPTVPSGLIPFDDISGGAVVGGCIGFTAGVVVSFSAVYRYPPDPPPERLLGKSPEYVEFYTDAYRSKARSLRTKWAAAGAATPVLSGLVLFLTP